MAKKKRKRRNKAEEVNLYEDSDETFAFIAGYTEGGVPFGTTWEELGLEPFATQEEVEAAYDRMDGNVKSEIDEECETNDVWDVFI